MNSLFETLPLAVIPLFVAMDPIGLIPLFLGMTKDLAPSQRQKIAYQAICTATVIVISFMFLGKLTFRLLGISVSDFQIGGGLILLGIAATDLLSAHEKKLSLQDDFGVVPLGLPLIAGPATLTTLLILMDSVGLCFTFVGLLINLGLLIVAFRFAEKLALWIGITGLRAISKIISLLLAAIAIHMIRQGWHSF